MSWKEVAHHAVTGVILIGIFWSFSSLIARMSEAENRCVSLKVHP